ncbi:hypothetical protein GG344DRAFT_78060 [Lentinula edodes]|nr:hypothetical protein GG344DRAFT_78060 [Lentinula edodes]
MDITNSRVDLPGAPGSKVDPAIATARESINSGYSRSVRSEGSGPTIPRTFDVSALFWKRIISPNPGTPVPVTRLPLPIAPKFATINTVIEALPSRKDDRHFPTLSSTGLIHNRYSLLSSGKEQAPKRNVWVDAVHKSSFAVSPLQRTCQPPRLAAKNSVVPQSFMKDYSSPDQHFVHQSNPLYIEWAPWHFNDYGVSFRPSPEDGGDCWTIVKRRKNRILS